MLSPGRPGPLGTSNLHTRVIGGVDFMVFRKVTGGVQRTFRNHSSTKAGDPYKRIRAA